ncbi:unnamed protein product [Mytilus coruscus]|uniref:C2H2-type domain-containing protein n=1 Tax=Mytilus coruscus TaxID=42192 RepID=A0A6J8E3L3_MYTCO|nr:unnamed protein product [Mytilus coruscus]
MEKECWICPEKFDTTKQLKSHLGSSLHSKMEVVCPFCLDRPTKYKRVWELKDHCNRFHKPAMQDMRPDILSEGNAYYLAVHPACYRKVVRPTAFYSPSARDLKKAMQAWLKKSKDTYRTPEEWEQGWKVGTKFDGPPGEELFQPVYSGDETRAASSSSMDMDITRPDAWRITYVALVPQSIMVEAIFGRETYRFAIADTLLTDVKYVSALTRRMLAIPQGGKQSAGRKHKLLGKTYSDRVTLAVKLLGLPEKYITNIHRLESDFYTLPTTELFDPPSKNPPCHLHLLQQRSLQKFPHPSVKKPEKPSSAPVTAIPSSPKASTSKPSRPPTTPVVTTNSSALSPISTGYMPSLPPPAKKPKISTIPYTPEKPTQPGPTYIPTPKQLLATIITEDVPNIELRTPAERATSLLRLGGMPWFPPARRDWTGEVQVKLPGDVLTKNWPPQGWKEKNQDTKKLNWEFIAFQYEQVSNHTTVFSRAGLLDIICLPYKELPHTRK